MPARTRPRHGRERTHGRDSGDRVCGQAQLPHGHQRPAHLRQGAHAR